MTSPLILLVEPSLFVQYLLQKNLHALEMCVHKTYTSGQSLIEELPTHFDLLLIDYNLPDMNGLELAEQVLQHLIYAKVVLLIPEHLSHESRDFIAHGIQATLVKPFDEESLQRVLIESVASV